MNVAMLSSVLEGGSREEGGRNNSPPLPFELRGQRQGCGDGVPLGVRLLAQADGGEGLHH